ncbi:uncharacterized protein LOC124274073 [Haliotis rubra]|uniref:uncharacterized protein LOC124274073 n=1 Tax=Haliotis rubra TaxID=36100 RepID=UPI001EE4FAFE|nr:uncharacterized protein LOC124274073 [Haliotis rubra]
MSFLMKTCFCLAFCLVLVSSQAPVSSRDADPKDIKNVHLIFMNHLDVGFNGISPTLGFINNVLNKYFTVYFPRAITVGLQLNILGYGEKLVYMTHPWLVSMYLDCPPNLVLAGGIHLQVLYILGYAEKLVYMTHPWLVSMYVDCPQTWCWLVEYTYR